MMRHVVKVLVTKTIRWDSRSPADFATDVIGFGLDGWLAYGQGALFSNMKKTKKNKTVGIRDEETMLD